jgi:aspartate/methionine/tyrosine aminotransferase
VKPTHVDANALCKTLRRDHEVSVVPGRFFEQPDYIRIALCTDTAVLRAGLRAMGEVLGA